MGKKSKKDLDSVHQKTVDSRLWTENNIQHTVENRPSLCQPVQDPGAGEDQDPAIWLPWILIIPHNKTVASSVPAEPGMEQVKLDRHNNVFVRDGFSENKGH